MNFSSVQLDCIDTPENELGNRCNVFQLGDEDKPLRFSATHIHVPHGTHVNKKGKTVLTIRLEQHAEFRAFMRDLDKTFKERYPDYKYIPIMAGGGADFSPLVSKTSKGVVNMRCIGRDGNEIPLRSLPIKFDGDVVVEIPSLWVLQKQKLFGALVILKTVSVTKRF